MSYKLSAMFAIPWAIAAILALLANLDSTPVAGQSGEATIEFVNSSLQPEQVTVQNPAIGDDDSNWIGTAWQFTKLTFNWIVFMANAATLNYPEMFTGWMQAVRFGLLVLAGPMLYIVAKEGASLFAGAVRGIGSIIPGIG